MTNTHHIPSSWRPGRVCSSRSRSKILDSQHRKHVWRPETPANTCGGEWVTYTKIAHADGEDRWLQGLRHGPVVGSSTSPGLSVGDAFKLVWILGNYMVLGDEGVRRLLFNRPTGR